MTNTSRLIIAFAIAALPWIDAEARLRAPPAPRAQKIVAKIGAVTASNNAAALAAMLVGPGVIISDATFSGDAAAAGIFSGGQMSVGIDSGVVLSTGEAVNVQGPNQSDSLSTDFGRAGDAQLDALVAPFTTQDAAILEFDVTPTADTLSVRFVFASEEYNEFVDTAFNDVLAIFVNGVNCANFGGRPVNVNSINNGFHAALYIDNEARTRNTEMDGLTIALECVAAVNPNVKNHVRIAIADTSDGIYDAAVFLAAGGVRSPGAGPLTSSSLLKVIEYYHAVFDHYFMTGIADEITKLDNGTFVGWTRTGEAFNVFLSGTVDTSEVCRFFSTSFGLKSSHFYTPSATECAIRKLDPSWQFEGAVFNVSLPAADATCPVGTQPLYRLYNDGMGAAPNHRYTTAVGIFDDMRAKGWIPEGAGVGIIACVPT